jgi:hypothetical protein
LPEVEGLWVLVELRLKCWNEPKGKGSVGFVGEAVANGFTEANALPPDSCARLGEQQAGAGGRA